MSVVSNIVLFVSCVDEPGADDSGAWIDNPDGEAFRACQQWLREHDYPELKIIDQHFGGNKRSEAAVGGAAINYFDEDAFAAFAMEQDWSEPDAVVLIIQTHESRARVWWPSRGELQR